MKILVFFMLRGIIFDFMRTLYDPEEGELFSGVLPLLRCFKEEGIILGLVTFGGDEKRKLIKSLELEDFLDWYRIVEEKTPKVFVSFAKKFNFKAQEVLVVGDLINQEIAVGKSLGMVTVWVTNRLPTEWELAIKSDYSVVHIQMLEQIVSSFNSK